MIISVNWLKKYIANVPPIDQLAKLIGARLVEIESITNLHAKYAGAVVVEVKTCIEHPNSDHLHICRVYDGGKTPDVPRDENGYVEVVCGAPNVHAGMKAVWLPPKTIVPETYGTNDELVLSARKLRGVLSQGMMASPMELDLWDEHEGILDVTDLKVQPGDSIIDVFDLDDYLLEVENKSLTHRPDCFGVIGFAREVAAILGEEAKTPEWFNDLDGAVVANKSDTAISVTIADPTLCNRYECVAMDGIDGSRDLPQLMRSELSRVGVRSISAPVDITNYLMMETGQPLHAFDLDKVIAASPTKAADIVVRAGQTGEKLELLDGRTIELADKDIVIAAGNSEDSVPIALAGAMGGKATEITTDTKRALIESATFNLYNLRNTQFRHGIFSEAITRFTKGQPSLLTHPVLLRTVAMLEKYAGGRVISNVVDSYPIKPSVNKFDMPTKLVTDVLGHIDGGYTPELISSTLHNLQYDDIDVDDNRLRATAPWWRTDLHINEDIIEDIGRVNSYDAITATSPQRDFSAAEIDSQYAVEMELRKRLREAGGNEVYSYSFIHGDLLDKVGDDKAKAFRIVNAISPNLQYYRRNLLPNLVELARDNLRAGYDDFMLFEVGKVHRQGQMDSDEPNLPAEIPQVAGVLTSKDSQGSAFYQMKHTLNYVFGHESLSYVRLDQAENLDSSLNLFESKRAATVYLNDQLIGAMGEFNGKVRREFKLPNYTAGFILLTKQINLKQLTDKEYTPVMRYQGTSRDVTLRVMVNTSFEQVLSYVQKQLTHVGDHIAYTVTPAGIFALDEATKNVTLHIDFHDRDKTIKIDDVNAVMHRIEKHATEINAKVI